MEQYVQDSKQGEKGVWLSIAVYVCLSALKLIVGGSTNSEALAADGYNNLTDIIASIAVLIGLKISRKPADHDHRYGHSRAETIASLVASFLMVTVGLQVLYEAFAKLSHPSGQAAPDSIAAWTALVCAAAMYGVYNYNLRLARKINSQAVAAVAQDNRSDALVSMGAFVGIVGSRFGLPWLDPAAALVVGGVICKTAWDIFRDASHSLTDGFDSEELQKMKDTVRKTRGVKSIVDMKARIVGNETYVDVTIGVHPRLTVTESHDITELIEDRIHRKHNVSNVLIHIEPFDDGG